MLRDLKISALAANLQLKSLGLDSFGYGNVSVIDRESGLIVVRPQSKNYDNLSVSDMLLVDLMGNIVEGEGKPTEDVKVQIELYRNFAQLEALALVRSPFVTAFAQAGRDIPFYGALHADYFCGNVPCTRRLDEHEFDEDYEKNVARAVADEILAFTPEIMPAVLVHSHGAFVFGKDAMDAIHTAAILEETAKIAFLTEKLTAPEQPCQEMLEKRFYARHEKTTAEEDE